MTVETDDDAVRKALTPLAPGIAARIRVMQEARRSGIKVQAAVSPVLPHDALKFAPLLAKMADRVIVDTYTSGDGAHGRRTAATPISALYAQLGWTNWRDESAAHRLHDEVGRLIGADRVSWSQAGFNWLAQQVAIAD